MKKLILTAILTAILPVFLANAEDNNNNPNPPGKKHKQGQDGKGPHGKCHGKDGKPKNKDGQGAPPNN